MLGSGEQFVTQDWLCEQILEAVRRFNAANISVVEQIRVSGVKSYQIVVTVRMGDCSQTQLENIKPAEEPGGLMAINPDYIQPDGSILVPVPFPKPGGILPTSVEEDPFF